MIEQITIPIWVSLSNETRGKLREIFKIPMSTHTEVVTDHMGKGIILCDGSTNVDLQVITVEKLQDFLGSIALNENIYDLFKRAVMKIESKEETVESTARQLELPLDTRDVPKNAIEVKRADIKADQDGITEIKTSTTFRCPECIYENASKQGMRMHMMRKHKN